MIILLRLKVNLALTIFLLSVCAVIVFGINVEKALVGCGEALIAKKSLRLYVIVTTVIYVATVQKTKHMFDRLISSLNIMVRDSRIVAMIGPAIVGFLPMPGGALMSAPLVDVSTKEMNLKPEFNTFLNYWFRHVWEFIWPVYASLLLFQTLAGIPMKTVILYLTPFTVLNIITGLIISFFYFRKHGIKRKPPRQKQSASRTARDFFEGVWPILLVIMLFFILSIPLHYSLPLVALVLTFVKRMSFKEVAEILFSKSIGKIMLLVAAVMIFQKIVIISDAFAALETGGMSVGMLVLVCFLVSFSMGLLTGLNIAFVGISYPILQPLLQVLPESQFMYMSLYVYVIGFAGILLSPVHFCLVLTNEYFKSTLYKVYKYLAPPGILLAIVSTILALVLGA
jgi:integral membrane protein (TIGR00529 family)